MGEAKGSAVRFESAGPVRAPWTLRTHQMKLPFRAKTHTDEKLLGENQIYQNSCNRSKGRKTFCFVLFLSKEKEQMQHYGKFEVIFFVVVITLQK